MSALIDILPRDVREGTESIVERWLRQPGDRVRLHEPLVELNTDKAVVEIPSPAEGILKEILKEANDQVGAKDILGRIEADRGASVSAKPRAANAVQTLTRVQSTRQDLSPAVRQLARKHGVDLARISGSGRGGRITLADVQAFLAKSPTSDTARSRLVPHSPLRRRIAEHMAASVKTAPHVTAVFEADMSAVVEHRRNHRAEFQAKGVRLTYTAYFVAAAVQALREVPEVNSRWHDDALELFHDCHIGIATAVEGGLLVPVIHRAQDLDLLSVAAKLDDLTTRAHAGKLEPAELRDGTFTITNHGVSGSVIATPIIHQPQTAILGIGKIEKRLVVVEEGGRDMMQIKPTAFVTLTIDHRALDGFQANRFLTRFVAALMAW